MTNPTTALTFEPVDGPLGAFVHGFEPARPFDEDLVARLAPALSDHQVLVFRGQAIEAATLVALGRAFGELEILPEPEKRHPDHPEIFNLSNVRSDGEIVTFDEPQAVFLRGTERWHTDSSFREVPCLCTMLHAVEVPPEGGDTLFADMRAAYAALSEHEQAALDGVQVVHSYGYSRANNPGGLEPMSEAEKAKYPPVVHPLVRTNGDGRRSLYLGGHASHIVGRDESDGRQFLAELTEAATEPRFVYEHRWRADDLVVWDNRTTLHRLRPYDITQRRRVMRRVTVAGTESVT